MPKKITQFLFDSGIALGAPPDKLPEGYCVRNKGIHPLAGGSFRSRPGSSLIRALNAHSIIYFGDNYHFGVGTDFYRLGSIIQSSLSGSRLVFAEMSPVAGVAGYLFVTDGSTLFKVDSAGNVTNWGLVAPTSAPLIGAVALNYTSIRNATYKWTASGSGTTEFYCEIAAGGDPSLPSPTFVRENGAFLTLGILGSLNASEYGYGDNDSLGYSTIYVRLSDGADPDSKAIDYVDYTTETTLASGTWKYKITWKNSTTGHRSNAGSSEVSLTTINQDIQLTSIPQSSDSQADQIEIWRTVVDGDVFFLLATVADGTATYTDDGTVTLATTELSTDNLIPYSDSFDCLGPYNASMFWLRSTAGEKGRVYYSPIGRAESVEGFINVGPDDRPLLKLFQFQGQLGVIGEAGIYVIGGGNPYIPRKVPGCPGTVNGNTVAVIPTMGIIYEASDGVRVFDGASSIILTPGSVERLFRGDSLGGLTSFTGTVAAYCRSEYFITDGSQTLAFDIMRKRWRDLGVGFGAIYYNEEQSEIAVTLSSSVVAFETEGQITDNSATIAMSFEPPHITFEDPFERLLQHLIIDIDTSSQLVTVTLIHDATETQIATITHTNRTKQTFAVGITAREFGLRFTGNLSGEVEIHGINYIFDR